MNDTQDNTLFNTSMLNLKKFQCPQCQEYFRFRRHYDKHLEGHKHNNCKHCDKLFTVRKQLVVHLHEEHGIKLQDLKYICQFCDKVFVKKLSLYQHYQIHAIGKNVCLHCGGFFSELSEFLKHQEKHKHTKPWKCDECDEKFSRRQQYNAHIQDHQKYKCLTCNKSFSAQSKLAEHKKKGHEINQLEAKYVCEKCDRSFHLRRAMVLHQRVHQGESLEGKNSRNKNMRFKGSHLKHLAEDAGTGSEDRLKNKQKTNYVQDAYGSVDEEEDRLGSHETQTQDKSEPEKCNYCDYRSSCKANLKRHMEFHTEDRKFICECCGASFHMLSTLKEHYLYVHTEKRSFPCPKCDKSFKRKCGLNRHLRDHSESRPFACHCGQFYKRMSHLKRHQESSHGLVSQPRKLCRLRRNESGMLVPKEEDIICKPKRKGVKSSTCKNNQTKEGISFETSNDGKGVQLSRLQESKEMSLNHYSMETNSISCKEVAVKEMAEVSISEEKIHSENEAGILVNNNVIESSQVFSLHTDTIGSSKIENPESIKIAISQEPQISFDVGYILDSMSNNQGNCLQNIGVILDDQIISYPSSQVVDLVQEPSDQLSVVDLVQIVPHDDLLSGETTVYLCLSSDVNHGAVENLNNSSV